MHDPPPARGSRPSSPASPASPARPDRDIHFQTCLVCLATDVKMFDLEQYNLSKSYAALVGYQCGAEEGMPDTVCYLCAMKLNKFKAFRAMSRRAYSILRGLLVEYDEITQPSVREIDRKQNNLESTLTCSHIQHMGVDSKVEISIDFKLEQPNPLDNIHKVNLEPSVIHKTENEDMAEDIDSEDEVRSNFKHEGDDEPMDYDGYYVNQIPALKADDGPKTVKKPTKGIKIATLTVECEKNNEERGRKGNIENKRKEIFNTVTKPQVKGESIVKKRKRKITKAADSKTENERDSGKPPPPAAKTDRKYSRRRPGAKQYTIYTPEYYQSIAEVTVMTEEEQMDYFKQRGEASKYKDYLFSCDDCYQGFMYKQAYETHMLKHDPSAGEMVCNICKIRRKNNSLLLKHISMNHRTKFACKKCNFVCSNSFSARLHSGTHSDATYTCDVCNINFDQLKTYTGHMYAQHPESVSCATCGNTFLTQDALNNHRTRFHKMEVSDGGEVPCEQCGVVFRSEGACSVHRSTFPGHNSKDGLIACEFCEKKFAETAKLQEHMKKHRARTGKTKNLDEGLECEQCGEHLPTNRSYFVHFRQAHPDKTRTRYYRAGRNSYSAIMCEHCGKVFQSPMHYRDHMNTHIGAKPYKCEYCDKGFTSAVMRAQHHRVHTKEKPFTCELCNTQFGNQANFQRHQNTVHTDVKLLSCDICDKTFKYRRSLEQHIQYVHYKKPWPKRNRTRPKKTDAGDLGRDLDDPGLI